MPPDMNEYGTEKTQTNGKETAAEALTGRSLEFDDYLSKYVGQFGRRQICLFCLISVEIIFGALHSMSPVFIAMVPEHWCSLPDTNNSCTNSQIKDVYIPKDGATFASCEAYNISIDTVTTTCENGSVDTSAGTVGCQGYEYSTTYYGNTIVSEWDLVCGKAGLVSTINAVFMIGRMAGCFIFGPLTDRLGRRPIVLVLTLAEILGGILVSLAPSYAWIIVARFILGFVGMARGTAAFILTMELVGPKWRVAAGSVYMSIWGFGYALFAGLAYAFRQWRHLALAIALPEILLLAVFIPLLPDSPRWQLIKGQTKKKKVPTATLR